MQFNYTYKGISAVQQTSTGSNLSFAPDLTREPTYFRGELRQNIAFREAIGALHDVVVSDLRFKPKDRSEYLAWAARQEQIDWQLVAAQRQETAQKLQTVQKELTDLYHSRGQRWSAFYQSRQKYFDYLYQKDRDAWFVLDPVITVHPDELFFECFSQDESSYGRLGANYEVFQHIDEFACGTTNIDYSAALYDEFQKIRSYRRTYFEVDPSGFGVQTSGEQDYKEVKIDLPDSWVRGFLQVSSAMSLPTVRFDLEPMDVYNLCFILRRHKEKQGPRSMRYHLTPGEPIRVTFDPWGYEVLCPRSIYTGTEAQTIRVWGRRRITILERLIPVARKFTIHLLGTGLPSFYVADLGDLSFTLGLSGWTANDWARSGNFDLLAPRLEVDPWTKQRIFNALKDNWAESPDALAQRLQLDRPVVLGALAAYTQAGRAIYDLNRQVYRVRELSREPLPLTALRFANEREQQANQFLTQNAVHVLSANNTDGVLTLSGTVRHGESIYTPSLTIDGDERLIAAECTCNWHQYNKLFKGPCEHILALRMAHSRML
ncbi:MAG: SWIM zinc finger family protein [Anaerolineae bacterium]|nr:SWIM zinc finger family protein [Gloeobacterales cyanobacterium ES-bin-313]